MNRPKQINQVNKRGGSIKAQLMLLVLLLTAVAREASAQAVTYDPTMPPESPTLALDKADYLPGETANISGSGYLPFETVTLQVLHADGTPATGADHSPWTVFADGAGKIATTWEVCTDDCLGSVLELTATGAASGKTGRILFSDAGLSNGGFETGNFSGWAVVNTGNGNWFVYTGGCVKKFV